MFTKDGRPALIGALNSSVPGPMMVAGGMLAKVCLSSAMNEIMPGSC